jgi:hypothetical protein
VYLVAHYFRIVAGHQNAHQLELIVEPQRPFPGIALEQK